jgi:biotin carboxyl carrier protein
MKFRVTISGRQRIVEIERHEGLNSVRVDGVPVQAEAREIQPGRWSLLLDGSQFDAIVLKDRGAVEVHLGLARYRAEVQDARRPDVPAATSGLSRPIELTSLMPGKVIRILVGEGQRVSPEEGIVVVEAMKMENELRLGHAAVVEKVLVRPGQLVESGAALVRFAPSTEGV